MFDDLNQKSKTQTQQPETKTPIQAKLGEPEIHTMPMEYYLGSKTKSAGSTKFQPSAVQPQQSGGGGGKKKKLNIIIAIVLVVVVAFAAYLLYASFSESAPQETPLVQETLLLADEEATPMPDEQPVEELETSLPPDSALLDLPEAKIIFDPADLSQFTLSLMASQDSDKDGLTDVEEELIGTDPSLVDSDGDSYRDGEEMANFYSPLDQSSVRLAQKDFLKGLSSSTHGFKLLYPRNWLLDGLGLDSTEYMLTSADNEFVNIIIDQKRSNQSLQDWYLEKAPGVKFTDIKRYKTFNKLDAVESPDGFTVYFAQLNTVYIINYNIGLKEEANYPAIFKMIVNSFEFISEPKSITVSSNVNNYAAVLEGMGLGLTIDNSAVTVSETCGGPGCFARESFVECLEGTANFKFSPSLEYMIEVIGPKDDRCEFQALFLKHPNPDWEGQEMICSYSFGANFYEAVKDKSSCSGALADLF